MPEVDLAKRRRIMQRSMKLGHCICDPRRPCPCDVFKEDGICPCAGERPEPQPAETVRLTDLVHNAGCASKIAPGDLEVVLNRLPAVTDPAVLSGMPAGDDAGIYRLSDGTCLVQTVDVMTPCVDDAYTFGRICAANCLSDVYAMGGVPRTALSILGFPSERLDGSIMYRMMKGAMDVFAEADVALIGGHSIKDDEIKLGFSITGTIPPDQAVSHETARVGDRLVLTKALGAGVLNFCRQIGRPGGDGQAVAESMAALNRAAAEAMNEVGVSACTDVTGFGLFGHLISMCRHSGVTAQIHADRLPAFAGALEALADGVVPGAVERNREYVGDDISAAEDVDEARVHLGFDAQTSGGLLMAVPAARYQALLDALAKRGVAAATIGEIVAESGGKIAVTLAGQDASAAPLQETDAMPNGHDPFERDGRSEPCCSPASDESAPAGVAEGESTAAGSLQAWGALMRSAGQAGLIDEKTKELINFALVVMARCDPCFAAHYGKALKMGITPEELAEAAWCAVAMGGAPVKLFYDEMLQHAGAAKGGRGCC
jgi:selenide,water dikinase